METGNHQILDLELDRKLALYQEDILLLNVQAAGWKSHVLHKTGPSLLMDFRKMVNNPAYSNVTFICEDGGRVQASRMLLVARSEVLRSLLSNGMAETEQSEVLLPEVSSGVLLLILTFLYTGELWEGDLKFSVVSEQGVQAHPAQLNKEDMKFSPFSLDWLFMLRAIKAAQFLLLNELECMMITRLWVDLPRHILCTEEVLNQVTGKFTTICNFIAVMNDGASRRHIYLLGLHLLKIMSEHDLTVIHLRNLSYESMDSYLYHTKNHSKDETWNSSFREYIRLWQLITWCISSTTEMDNLHGEDSSLFLPEPKRAASLLMNSEEEKQILRQFLSVVTELRQKFAAEIQGEQFEALKGMINLVHIHPELLIHFVEPVGIFSSKELGAAVRDQLLRASTWRKQIQNHHRKSTWQVADAGKIRLITDGRLGSDKLAVANVAMWCHSAYEWEIVHFIEDPYNPVVPPICRSFTLEVGFLSLETRQTMEDSCLSDNGRGWAFRLCKERETKGIKCMFFENGEERATPLEGSKLDGAPNQITMSDPPSKVSNKRDLKWAIHVRMKLDRVKNTCSLSCKPDGKEYTVVCKELSRGLLFPAVYVVYDTLNCESETHIKLNEGFELTF